MGNAIRLIRPYRSSGTWVFDDPEAGLVREPFVAGVPAILDRLVAGIPRASEGFRLLFSSSPFPGYQASFIRTRSEHEGSWYRDELKGDEGWLCPALFKYFEQAPERLFIRVEAIEAA
ncbi:MAG TPA: DUF6717 family protein [Bdellovibrionota bacterium]|nr:DUF6717 family protein [Bdellovibrionota bacterium]